MLRRGKLWGVLITVVLFMTACANAIQDEKNSISNSAPGLKPASSLLNERQEAFESSNPILGTYKEKPVETPIVDQLFNDPTLPTATPLSSSSKSSSTMSIEDSVGMDVAQDSVNTKLQVMTPLLTPGSGNPTPDLLFDQAPLSEADCIAEIEQYQADQTSEKSLPKYVAHLVASCYLARNDQRAAIDVYELALAKKPDRLSEVELRQSLAQLYEEIGDFTAAIAQYDAILVLAQTDITRGKTLYLAGNTEIRAGNLEAGYGRYLSLINAYPSLDESYLALRILHEVGRQVDAFQEGLVNYYARDFASAINAFNRHLETNQEPQLDVFLYLAWSHEGLGNIDAGLEQLDAFIKANESLASGNSDQIAKGKIERAKMQERAGRIQAAYLEYQSYLTQYPQGDQAPFAAWSSAVLVEDLGDIEQAVALYRRMAENYPDHPDADEALFRAGLLSWRLDQIAEAQKIWQEAIENYPQRDYGSASLLWLLKNSAGAEKDSLVSFALNSSGQGYYALRAKHLAMGLEPFAPNGTFNVLSGDTGRDLAETWLKNLLNLDPKMNVAEISGELARDVRFLRGNRLWQLGMQTEAVREFESLRIAYAQDALASYRLALHFRDLGLYRLSVFAAISVMNLAGIGVSEAPRFIARLAYPVYYTDLVLTEAQSYGYDPFLLFSLIREESYFDSFATSAVGARGITQILPDTGIYIAQQLNYPGYDNDDLYLPEVGIAFGAFFLDHQLSIYDDRIAPALSAYNAGPGFANRWYEEEREDFDSYLEIVDFPETQRYIKQLYIVYSIYHLLYS